MVVKYNKVFFMGCRSRLISASLHQAMRSTDYASSYVARWLVVDFRSSLFRGAVSPDARCRIDLLLLRFLPVGIQLLECQLRSSLLPMLG